MGASNEFNQGKASGFHERTVCYIDLLGFSSAVLGSGRGNEEIANVLIEAEELVQTYNSAELTFQSLSNSIFISTINSDIKNALNLVSCSQELFTFFLTKGFLPRGAIDTGNCLVSNSIILGEPVVRAVKLEENVSNYPRIILSKRSVELLLDAGQGAFIDENVIQGEDGPFWINPFVQLIDFTLQADSAWKSSDLDREEAFNQRGKFLEEINSISEFISSSLFESQENRRVFEFYFWLYHFFNKSFKGLANDIGNDVKLPRFNI